MRKHRPFLLALILILALPLLAADVSGKWVFSVELDIGSGSPTFVFQQMGETLTGTYTGAAGQSSLKGTVKGEDIQFEFEVDLGGEKAAVHYAGKILGPDKMKGTAEYGSAASGTWTANRSK